MQFSFIGKARELWRVLNKEVVFAERNIGAHYKVDIKEFNWN